MVKALLAYVKFLFLTTLKLPRCKCDVLCQWFTTPRLINQRSWEAGGALHINSASQRRVFCGVSLDIWRNNVPPRIMQHAILRFLAMQIIKKERGIYTIAHASVKSEFDGWSQTGSFFVTHLSHTPRPSFEWFVMNCLPEERALSVFVDPAGDLQPDQKHTKKSALMKWTAYFTEQIPTFTEAPESAAHSSQWVNCSMLNLNFIPIN